LEFLISVQIKILYIYQNLFMTNIGAISYEEIEFFSPIEAFLRQAELQQAAVMVLEEEEEVKEKDVSKTIDGITNLSLSNDLEGIVSSKTSDKEQEAVSAKELISAATVARREAEERARLLSVKREERKLKQAEAALLQQKPAPLGRIRSGMWCSGNWLYIYGGLREETVKMPKISALSFGSSKKATTASLEKEITLDDMWRIDLRERTHWEMLLPGTMHKHAWRQEPESDDEEED
jgi:hypothetical protein